MTGRRGIALVGLGVRRVVGRLTGRTPERTLLTVAGVAAAIGLLVVVTGLAIGMAASGTVASEGVNYWIVPEAGGAGSTPIAYEGAALGDVHRAAATLAADARIAFATPVAIQPLRLSRPGVDEAEYVLALGIVPPADGRPVAGLATGAMTPGDPLYNGGGYNGTWTGDLVASAAVRDTLGVRTGDRLTAEGGRPFDVVAVEGDDVSVGVGTVPVVLVHLAELQAVTDTAAADQADQLMVATDDSAVRDRLDGFFPGTDVVSRSGFARLSAGDSGLPLAMAVAAGLVALGVGVAFVATTMGLELTAARRELAILQAVGYRQRAVSLVVVTETLTLALLGGGLGIALGWAAILGLNAGLASALGLRSQAVFDPLLVPYSLAAALAVALLAVGYPLIVAWRTDTLGELAR